jgi:hypothetical protein
VPRNPAVAERRTPCMTRFRIALFVLAVLPFALTACGKGGGY